ncbi:MAG: ATP-binding cassette domain-containing protein [Lentimicrobium sp.]|jgi:zinc transport system ATP-binding protein|nr:ATP-binding cassette domain-containing protein [Lentimicrobium sp.]MDD2527099.1 ATP-binding cassette domain-containing protein [Lentimicrobiaceae bacterium]MDD4597854.1 ATP-binding cassette domain-containing protein [Lentimicrobiaceae bacterium]HAH57631.1 zinc ABC transporter ATP-binding protein [Bacteroidales bacterium]
MKKILELTDVSAGYDQELVLTDINFTVYEQDFIGIIGPNGGGKTTLVKLILGMIKPAAGRIEYSGSRDLNHIGYLPQVSNTDRDFPISVIEVVLSGLMSVKGRGFYSVKERKLAHDVLEMLGIGSLAKKSIGKLSGGQMQRVYLGRAIIARPQLLILDEPNTFVDNQFERDLYELLKVLNNEMAILMVSHDVGTITSYIKTIACVNRNLHYHPSNVITQSQLNAYNCPIQLITHGHVPHTVLGIHQHQVPNE